jgi:hypothetical protein
MSSMSSVPISDVCARARYTCQIGELDMLDMARTDHRRVMAIAHTNTRFFSLAKRRDFSHPDVCLAKVLL